MGLAQTVGTRREQVRHLRIPNEKGHGAVSSRHGNMPSGDYDSNLDLTREEFYLLFSCYFLFKTQFSHVFDYCWIKSTNLSKSPSDINNICTCVCVLV